MGTIRSKIEYYRLWRAGVLGNRPRTWATLEDLLKSGWPGPVTLRSTQVGFKTKYDLSIKEAATCASLTVGATFNESLPDDKLLIQGEAMRGERGLELTYSIIRKPMKLALAEETRWANGVVAKALLDHYLWPPSRDDFEALWDLYPDSVIEFGAYSIAVGDQPHRNTLIWEVRNY